MLRRISDFLTEQGIRLVRRARARDPTITEEKPLSAVSDRIESTVETGFEYRPGSPVRIHVVRRGPRVSVSDDGAAFDGAGRPQRWREAARRIEHELDVNFSRSGAISLPVVRVGPPEDEVVRRIAMASRAFYQELLEAS
jgi:hypothetical protein